jgi:outer membrane protein OmpA-like peptidoglycan-associated protein
VADSYYRTIKGKQYDRGLLEIVEKASKRSKAPLNKNIAKSLFDAIIDGGDYTDVEKRTLKYIRDNFNFAKEADEYLRTEIRKWAAKNSVPASKKSLKSVPKSGSKSSKKSKPTATSTISRMHDEEESTDTFYHVYDDENEDEIEPTPEYNELVELNRYGKKPSSSSYIRYVFVAIFIVVIICLFLIVRSCRGGSTSTAIGELQKPKAAARVLLQPHTEVEEGRVLIQFRKRSEAIRYINDLRISFIKQSLNVGSDASNQITTLAAALKSYPDIKIRVKGHTCFIGELDENKILSEERAKLIKDELVKQGVNPAQLDVRGFGETTNVDSNYTESGRIKNRRVDFSVLSIEPIKSSKP